MTDTTSAEAVSTFRQINGDPSNFSPNLRYQVVKSVFQILRLKNLHDPYCLTVSGSHCVDLYEIGLLHFATLRAFKLPI